MRSVPNRIIILVAVFLLPLASIFAAPPPPPPEAPVPPGLPLDGGIVLLATLSICYGIYKLNKKDIKKASN